MSLEYFRAKLIIETGWDSWKLVVGFNDLFTKIAYRFQGQNVIMARKHCVTQTFNVSNGEQLSGSTL